MMNMWWKCLLLSLILMLSHEGLVSNVRVICLKNCKLSRHLMGDSQLANPSGWNGPDCSHYQWFTSIGIYTQMNKSVPSHLYSNYLLIYHIHNIFQTYLFLHAGHECTSFSCHFSQVYYSSSLGLDHKFPNDIQSHLLHDWSVNAPIFLLVLIWFLLKDCYRFLIKLMRKMSWTSCF